jgi:hypothetical protein
MHIDEIQHIIRLLSHILYDTLSLIVAPFDLKCVFEIRFVPLSILWQVYHAGHFV